jgi:hypothetical protein
MPRNALQDVLRLDFKNKKQLTFHTEPIFSLRECKVKSVK